MDLTLYQNCNANGDVNMFTIELHHGGYFAFRPSIEYINGKLSYIDNVNVKELNLDVLMQSILRVLGYELDKPLYFHFVLPAISLGKGLIPLDCDADYKILGRYVVIVGQIDIYVEHGVSVVDNHGRSPIPNYLDDDGMLISPEFNKLQKKSTCKPSCSKQLNFDLNEPLNYDAQQANENTPCLEMVVYDPTVVKGKSSCSGNRILNNINGVPFSKEHSAVINLQRDERTCEGVLDRSFAADFYDPLFTYNVED